MNYSQSLRYLDGFLNLEQLVWRPDNRFWNLKRMTCLLDWLGHPEKDFFPVLIAGTKGKGSTGFFLESILCASKIRTGFYSSPHLEDPRERIRLQGKMISKALWAAGLTKIQAALRGRQLPAGYGGLTYFEIMTALAILAFQKEKIRIGLFEIGMGGRLDATNALDAQVALLTPIHYDHEAFLGHTLAKIAGEKAAIIRPGAAVVVSPQKAAALSVIRSVLRKQKAHGYFVKPLAAQPVGLEGEHQRTNAGAATQAAVILRDRFGFRVSARALRQGVQQRAWPGRLEARPGRPSWLLDAAHNPSSVAALVRYFKRAPKKQRLLIFGTSRDKKSDRLLQQLSTIFDTVILTRIPNPRSQELPVLLQQARVHFRQVYPAANVRAAMALARAVAQPKTEVVATGSFYLIGEIRKRLRVQRTGFRKSDR